MWKATLASLRAHRLRLVLTALSIVLGVAFVTGTLIFTDTLHNTFDQLFRGVYGKISVQVRQPSPVNDQFGDKSFIPMPMSILSAGGQPARRGGVGGLRVRLRPAGRQAQQGHHHDRRPDHRRQLRPGAGDIRLLPGIRSRPAGFAARS